MPTSADSSKESELSRITRKIIRIDEDKCDGCGICADACHEGAIQISGGKAKLVKESYCGGLVQVVHKALIQSGKQIPLSFLKIGIKGDILDEMNL